MKTAMLWMALGTVCLLLSVHAAFGQRVRLPSDTSSQGSVVTLAQRRAVQHPPLPPTPPRRRPARPRPPSTALPRARLPLRQWPRPRPTVMRARPATEAPARMARTSPNGEYPGTGSAARPTDDPPTLAPSASLAERSPRPGSWDPYAAGGSGGAVCSRGWSKGAPHRGPAYPACRAGSPIFPGTCSASFSIWSPATRTCRTRFR